tara:strand:- start:3527 stop:4390 length:864 start_codon:yes stop_codon:yes gene_type:complete
LGSILSNNTILKNNFSAVVIAYNSEQTIKRCLDSISNQDITPDELILVDDGSLDKTVLYSDGYNCNIIKNKVNKGRGYSRNLAVQHSKNELILFCDSSNIIPPNFFSKARIHFENKDIGAVFGIIKNDSCLNDVFSRWRAKYLFHEKTEIKNYCHETETLMTYACMVRRSSILSVGNFDKRLPKCEDMELGRRLINGGHKILSDPSLSTYSIRLETMTSLCVRFNRWHSNDIESFKFFSGIINTFKACFCIYARNDITERDFPSLLISISLPFWFTIIAIFARKKYN